MLLDYLRSPLFTKLGAADGELVLIVATTSQQLKQVLFFNAEENFLGKYFSLVR